VLIIILFPISIISVIYICLPFKKKKKSDLIKRD